MQQYIKSSADKRPFRILLIVPILFIAFFPGGWMETLSTFIYGGLIHFLLFASLVTFFWSPMMEKMLESSKLISAWGKTFRSLVIIGIMGFSMYVLFSREHHYLFMVTLVHSITMLVLIARLKKEIKRRSTYANK